MLLEDIRKLLPIGSVVLLKNGKKRLMITGVRQTEKDSGTEYDYMAVCYPEGSMGSQRFMFNHEDIAEIAFYGFNDAEREIFIEKLNIILTK